MPRTRDTFAAGLMAAVCASWLSLAPPATAQSSVPLPSTTGGGERRERVLRLIERDDTGADDPACERLAAQARAVLVQLGRGVFSPAHAAIEVSGLFTDTAGCDVLRPRGLTTAYDRGSFTVKRLDWMRYLPEVAPPGKRLSTLGSLIDRDRPMVWDVVITAVEEGENGSFRTTAQVTAAGEMLGERVQMNAAWLVHWQPGAEGSQPRIARIELRDYEEARARHAVFEDCTGAVLAGALDVAREVGVSADESYFDRDRLWGNDPAGMHGLAIGDVNGDDRDDVYLCLPGGSANALLVQQPDGTVRNQAAASLCDVLDLTRSALFADFDNDGDQDLALSVRNATVVLMNTGAGAFDPERGFAAPTRNPADFGSMAAADYDGDGRIDLFCARALRPSGSGGFAVPAPLHDARNGPPNHLLRNLGDFAFQDATAQTGLSGDNTRSTSGALWDDIDRDGDPDLILSNEFSAPQMMVNSGGQFADRARELGLPGPLLSRGVSVADFNGDGQNDLLLSNHHSDAAVRLAGSAEFRAGADDALRPALASLGSGLVLMQQRTDGGFDVAEGALDASRAGWANGAVFVDINNDGLEDVVCPAGGLTRDAIPQSKARDLDGFFWRRIAGAVRADKPTNEDYETGWMALGRGIAQGRSWAGGQRCATYLNLGDGTFADISHLSGLSSLVDGRAVATCDWDRDGDADLWVRSRLAPTARLMLNRTREHSTSEGGIDSASFVSIGLRGVACNRDAIGARVGVRANGRTFWRTLRAGEGQLSQSSKWLHFGLGPAAEIDEVSVVWPDGAVEVFSGAAPGGRYLLTQGAGAAAPAEVFNEHAAHLAANAMPDNRPSEASPVRLELIQRLALPTFGLVDTEGRLTTLEILRGRRVVVLFWSARDDKSVEVLRAFTTGLRGMPEAPVVLPVCVDGADVGAAKAVRDEIDPQMPLVMLEGAVVDLVDAVQMEVLGRPSDLRVPSAWFIDAEGLIEAILLGIDGPRDAAGVRVDWSAQGRVLFGYERAYAEIAAVLEQRGHVEWANQYRTATNGTAAPRGE